MEEKFQAELSAQTSLANLYKSQFDEQTSKVGNLNKVIKELQSMLRASARKQEDLIRDQNRNMINELENMGRKVSEVTTKILNVSVSDDSSSRSRLTSNIRYLRQEKDALTAKLKVSQTETARLKVQLDRSRDENNVIKKKLEDKTKAASDSLKTITKNVLLDIKKENLNLSNSVEMAKLKKEIDSNKAEQKALKESLVTKDAEIKKLKENSAQLKKVGTTYRAKFQAEETKTKELTAEKEKLNKDSTSRIADLEVETEELKKEKEKLLKKHAEKEARAKVALINAKDRITRVENEKKKLKTSCAGDETVRPSRPTIQPTLRLKRARDSTPPKTDMVSGSNDGEDEERPSGQQKKTKSEEQ